MPIHVQARTLHNAIESDAPAGQLIQLRGKATSHNYPNPTQLEFIPSGSHNHSPISITFSLVSTSASRVITHITQGRTTGTNHAKQSRSLQEWSLTRRTARPAADCPVSIIPEMISDRA